MANLNVSLVLGGLRKNKKINIDSQKNNIRVHPVKKA